MQNAETPSRWPRLRDAPARWAAITILGTIAGYVGVLLANHRHFYTDDTESQYVPLWLTIGRHLREGNLPWMTPENWMSGNLVAEGQGSLFNPVQLVICFFAPSFDNLVVLATVVKLGFTIVLALGIFRTCRAYGADPQFAALAAVAMPFSGWMLFFDQASWVLGLAGTAWLANAWASSVRYARGLAGPIPVFIFLYLAVSMGEVWPTLEAAVMVAAVIVGEFIYQRDWRAPLRLTIAAGCAGLAGLLTYLPGFFSSSVTWRDAQFGIKNDGFMTVPWNESLNASLPTTFPSFISWFGNIQPFPVVYIAWFLIPMLAFIDWPAAAKSARNLAAVGIFVGISLMWTAGPASIGPVRWPARALPMLALSALILIAVLLCKHGTLRNVRTRLAVSGGLIAIMLARSIASAPYGKLVEHLVGAAVVAALVALVVFLAVKRGAALAFLAIIATVPAIAFYQVKSTLPHPMSWGFPERVSDMKRVFPQFEGTTLQLGDARKFPFGDKKLDGVYSGLVVGNYAKDMGLDFVNGYTPLGHLNFERTLCMTWDGSLCPIGYELAFKTEPYTGKPIVDLLKVDQITLQRTVYPNNRWEQVPPPGWKWSDLPLPSGRWAWLLERRDGPVSKHNGRISATVNAEATSVSESDLTSNARVSSKAGGSVVFARLAWPGYTATLDGKSVETKMLLGSFLTIDLPAGTRNAELIVSYSPPGWELGVLLILFGLAGIAGLQWTFARQRRSAATA